MRNKVLSIVFLATVALCTLASTVNALPIAMPPRGSPAYRVSAIPTDADIETTIRLLFGGVCIVVILMAFVVSVHTRESESSTVSNVVRTEVAAAQKDLSAQMTAVLDLLRLAEERAKAADTERSALIERHAALVRERINELEKRGTPMAEDERLRLVHELVTIDPTLSIEHIDTLLTPKPRARPH